MLGEVLDGRCAARQPFQHGLEVTHEPGAVDVEVTQDTVQVRVREVDDLKEPVHELDMRVPPQLAEGDSSLGSLEHERVELAEQRRTADLCHWSSSLTLPPESSGAAAGVPAPESGRRRPWPLAWHPATSSTPADPRGPDGCPAPRRAPGRAVRPNRTRTRHSSAPSA